MWPVDISTIGLDNNGETPRSPCHAKNMVAAKWRVQPDTVYSSRLEASQDTTRAVTTLVWTPSLMKKALFEVTRSRSAFAAHSGGNTAFTVFLLCGSRLLRKLRRMN
mmetsp:Transcript_40443/g.72668  ORF Transcript_40443/g.72668 Transcript_40443/m.72668 type:complete len:107 (-) Transcript_40443:49-369(-)